MRLVCPTEKILGKFYIFLSCSLGKSNYLFVAIDRCTRTMIYWVYENKTAENTEDFMDKCLAFFPFKITHILTDNGLEFTNRLLKSKTGNSCQKRAKMDVKCEKKKYPTSSYSTIYAQNKRNGRACKWNY